MSLQEYRERVSRNGVTTSEAIVNNSKYSSSIQFFNSPFLKEILINDKVVKAIVTQGKTSGDKTFLLEPEKSVAAGSVVVISNKNYLVMDFKDEGINEIYPTGTLKVCNNLFPIKQDEIRVLLRDANDNPVLDGRGRPQYTTEIVLVTAPCIVESRYSFTRGEQQIALAEDRIEVVVGFVESENLKLDFEFKMYGDTYKVKNIDHSNVINSEGILIISAERKV